MRHDTGSRDDVHAAVPRHYFDYSTGGWHGAVGNYVSPSTICVPRRIQSRFDVRRADG